MGDGDSDGSQQVGELPVLLPWKRRAIEKQGQDLS